MKILYKFQTPKQSYMPDKPVVLKEKQFMQQFKYLKLTKTTIVTKDN